MSDNRDALCYTYTGDYKKVKSKRNFYPMYLVRMRSSLEKRLREDKAVTCIQDGVVYALNFVDLLTPVNVNYTVHSQGMSVWIDKICGINGGA